MVYCLVPLMRSHVAGACQGKYAPTTGSSSCINVLLVVLAPNTTHLCIGLVLSEDTIALLVKLLFGMPKRDIWSLRRFRRMRSLSTGHLSEHNWRCNVSRVHEMQCWQI